MEGTFIATFAIILVKILGMIYVIPFYSIIGEYGPSLYAYAYNIYNMFLDISTIGFPIAMSKITNEYNTLKMYDAKQRAYKISIKWMRIVSIIVFLVLFIFARYLAIAIIGNLTGGNTIEDVTIAIRCVSLAILVIPYLSVTKGYLQGHNIINISAIGNIIEQVVRITVVLGGSFIAIKVLHKGYVVGVDIALLGAFCGGIVTYIFIKHQMKKNTDLLSHDIKNKDKISNKEIRKKIVSYAVPFIIINTISSLYGFIDMLLVLRTMEYLNPSIAEYVAGSISTWSGKINMIITSIAMGMTVSLIPSIVESFTLKKWKDVTSKINSSLKMIIFVSLPMAVGLSFLSSSVWSIFYGYNQIGANVLSISVFVAVSLNIYMITSSIIQSLNEFKTVYISAILGFLINGLLDVPLMMLFNKIGIPSYLGALVASITGFLISSVIALFTIKRKYKINYKATFKALLKIMIPLFSMIVVLFLIKQLIPGYYESRLYSILYIIINSVLGASIYLIISWKMGLISDILGKEMIDKIKKKLTFKR